MDTTRKTKMTKKSNPTEVGPVVLERRIVVTEFYPDENPDGLNLHQAVLFATGDDFSQMTPRDMRAGADYTYTDWAGRRFNVNMRMDDPGEVAEAAEPV